MENNTIYVQQVVKWYNNKLNLALSILFWPVLIYGIYKTTLMSKKTKLLIVGILSILIVIGSLNKDSTYKSIDSGLVRQSPWNNSVDCVEHYLKHKYLRDPDSYDGIKWSKVARNDDGTYQVTHTFRARNGFGGMEIETITFTIASDGWTVIGTY